MKGLRTIFYIFLIAGMVLVFYSLTIPKYIDDNRRQALIDMYYQGKITKDVYYQKMSQITTSKVLITDIANGFVSFSLFGIVLSFISKVKEWKELKELKTQNKLTTFIMANSAWLLLVPNTFFYYYYRSCRGDYPPFADSIGIPIMQQIAVILFMLFPLNLFLLVCLYKSNLPTKLLIRPSIYKRTNILWNLFFFFFLLLDMVCLILFIIDGDHISIMVSMFFLYILLSLRAGKLNYIENVQNILNPNEPSQKSVSPTK